MDVGNSFTRNDDGEIKSIVLIQPSPVDAWGTCDPETTRPDGLRGWLHAFGHMLGATRKTDEARNHREARGQLGGEVCPLLSMMAWSWVCTRFTEDHRQKLRTVRLGLPTPPELTGTIALSYCEQALQQVYQRFDRLMRVVKHDAKSFELSGQESMAFHADQIVRQFDEAVDGWPYTDFTRDTAAEYYRLAELELQLFFGDDVLEPPAVADTAIPSDGPDESTNEFRLDGEQFGPFTETEFDVLQEMWEHREGPWPQKDAHFHWHGKWRWPQTQDGSPFHKHQGSIKKKFEKQGFKLPWKLKLKAFYWHGLAPREDG